MNQHTIEIILLCFIMVCLGYQAGIFWMMWLWRNDQPCPPTDTRATTQPTRPSGGSRSEPASAR